MQKDQLDQMNQQLQSQWEDLLKQNNAFHENQKNDLKQKLSIEKRFKHENEKDSNMLRSNNLDLANQLLNANNRINDLEKELTNSKFHHDKVENQLLTEIEALKVLLHIFLDFNAYSQKLIDLFGSEILIVFHLIKGRPKEGSIN